MDSIDDIMEEALICEFVLRGNFYLLKEGILSLLDPSVVHYTCQVSANSFQ